MKTNLATIERRRLLQAEAHEKARTELREVTEGMSETIALSRARGEAIITPQPGRGERPKPAKRLDGLDFLAHQKVITPAQYQAGRRWTAYYGLVETGDVKSCLGVLEIRSQTQGLEPGQRKVFARLKLQMAKDALGKHDGMIEALNSICGEGSRPSELSTDRRANERAVNFLNCALSILAKHWGL